MRLYLKYLRAYYISIMTYKYSVILTIIGQFLSSFFMLLGVTFLFNNFYSLAEFTYFEILLCYANILLSFSLAEFFCRGFDIFSYLLRNGIFDRILLRPRSAFFQTLVSTFEISRIGKLIQAIVVYLWIIPKNNISWTFFNIYIQIMMVFCGFLLFSCLFIVHASLCFYTTDKIELFNIITDGSKEFGKYPLAVYGNKTLKFFTYIIPIACIQYYPLCFLLKKTDNILYAVSPIYALIFIIPTFFLWSICLKHYKSTGS